MCKLERLKKTAIRMCKPGMVLSLVLAIFSTAALIYIFVTERKETIPAYIVYTLTFYSYTVLAIKVPKLAAKIKASVYKNKFGNRYMTDISYRTKISLYTSLSINLLYAIFKLIAGIHYASFWYGADALYFIVLSSARFILLRHVRKEDDDLSTEIKKYRFCGILLFVLNATLIGVVYQVVNHDMGYHYPGHLIYVVAAYTFYCLTLAIINIIKYRQLNSPVLSAIKVINFSKALVAIFALMTAMLVSFGIEESETFKSLMKSITGGGVSFTIFVMAVYMIIRANSKLKTLNERTSKT